MSDKMKEKLGDWLLDVAKYLLTAVAISTMFSQLSQPMILITATLSAAAVLALGLYLIHIIKGKK